MRARLVAPCALESEVSVRSRAGSVSTDMCCGGRRLSGDGEGVQMLQENLNSHISHLNANDSVNESVIGSY